MVSKKNLILWTLSGILISINIVLFFYFNKETPILHDRIIDRISQFILLVFIVFENIYTTIIENEAFQSRKSIIKPIVFFITFYFILNIGLLITKMIDSSEILFKLVLVEFCFSYLSIRYPQLKKKVFSKFIIFNRIEILVLLIVVVALAIIPIYLTTLNFFIIASIISIIFYEFMAILLYKTNLKGTSNDEALSSNKYISRGKNNYKKKDDRM